LRRHVKTIGSIILALVLLVVVVHVIGREETFDALARAGFAPFLAVGALQVGIVLLHSLAWSRTCRSIGLPIRFRSLGVATLIGQAVNILTPSAYLGGEPAKVIYVGRTTGQPYERLTSTVVLLKVWELLSFVLLFGLATLTAGLGYRETLFRSPYTATGVLLVVLAVGLLALGIVVWTALRRGAHPLTALVSGIARILPKLRFMERLRERCRSMEDDVVRVVNSEGLSSWSVFGMLFVTHVMIFYRPGLFFALGGADTLTFGELCLVFVVGQALLSLQLTPSSVGVLDAGLLGAFALVGLSVPDGMVFLLSVRLWDAVTVAVAAWICGRAGIAWIGAGKDGAATTTNLTTKDTKSTKEGEG